VSFFSKAVNKLENHLASNQGDENTMWIMYRILDLESKRAIIIFEVNNMIPVELNDIAA
jgi:hypothetical protein